MHCTQIPVHSIRGICIIFHCNKTPPRLPLRTKHHNTFYDKETNSIKLHCPWIYRNS